MESAFGVEHGVSKGIPKGLLKVAAKNPGHPMKPNKQVAFARERLAAHQEGRKYTGINQWRKARLGPEAFPHWADAQITRGGSARGRARMYADDLTRKP